MTDNSSLDECRNTKHVDGKSHGWLFDGDDPYIVCQWCGDVRDAINGRVITKAASRATIAPNEHPASLSKEAQIASMNQHTAPVDAQDGGDTIAPPVVDEIEKDMCNLMGGDRTGSNLRNYLDGVSDCISIVKRHSGRAP